MTRASTTVLDAVRGHQVPLVRLILQGQFEDPVCVVDAPFTVGTRRDEVVPRSNATGADDERPDAASGIVPAIGILWRESLVEMIVAGQNDFRIGTVEKREQSAHLRIFAIAA